MALTNPYCTLSQLRDQLSDSKDLATEGILERAINAASRWIDDVCGRHFWPETAATARRYRPDDPDVAWVHDISTTTDLVIATDTTGDGTYATTWASTDYDLEPLDADKDGTAYAWWRICAVDRYTFPTTARRPPLRVTAKWGWSAIPDDVTQACVLRAAGLFKRKDSPHGITAFDGFGAVRVTRSDPDVMALLNNYIRMDMAAV
jgi:hypothetical protein